MERLLFILVAVVTVIQANEFTCDMMRDDHLQQTRMGFQINTGSNVYQPGGQVKGQYEVINIIYSRL